MRDALVQRLLIEAARDGNGIVNTPTCKRGLARSVLDYYVFLLTIPHLTSYFPK